MGRNEVLSVQHKYFVYLINEKVISIEVCKVYTHQFTHKLGDIQHITLRKAGIKVYSQ